MRVQLRFLVAILIAAIILPSGRVQTQPNVPLITVDTLVDLGKTGAGVAGGALFLHDGNIIALWKSIPHVIDSKTGEVIRRMDTVHSSQVTSPKLSKDGTKLIAISMGPKLVVWDIPSGKLIMPPKDDLIDFCISPDGTKFYCTQKENKASKGAIYVYDMNTLMVIDTLLKKGIVEASYIAISPDGQTLAVSVYKKPNDEYDTKTNQVILIDLKDKTKYTVLETFEPQVYSMEFSPDGKQIAFPYSDGNNNIYIYIYNLESKQKKYIYQKDLNKISEFNEIGIGPPHFIDSNTLLFVVGDIPNYGYSSFIWKINESYAHKMIRNYPSSIDLANGLVLLCTPSGAISVLDSTIVSVKDNQISSNGYLAYNNNQLEYISNKAFVAESMIYDTTGKLVATLGKQPFAAGKNIIRINQPLPNGVYILTIKDKTNQFSYKFLVE